MAYTLLYSCYISCIQHHALLLTTLIATEILPYMKSQTKSLSGLVLCSTVATALR